MSRTARAILYAVLLTVGSLLAVKFHGIYTALMHSSPPPETSETEEAALTVAHKIPAGLSNTSAIPNGALLTNTAPPTNALSETTNASVTAPGGQAASNAPTLPARSRRGASSSNAPPVAGTEGPPAPSFASLVGYGAVLFLIVVCLSMLAAHDFTHFVAERLHKFILSDEGEGIKAPEYEHAEQVWADGRHLEAVQLMRDYHKNHPRELYVAIRIAEIYEKDLGNYLAAALEYEDVLRHRLRPEQWGWAAIHLANLYSGKLNQPDKAIALLRRIDSEYGDTSAATKARVRLEQIEGGAAGAESPGVPTEIEEEPAALSKLPKGFRPKKE